MEKEKTLKELRQERRARMRAEARYSVVVHFIAYVMVNAFLAWINYMFGTAHWWVLWSIGGWGFGLLVHALIAFTIPWMTSLRQRFYDQELSRLQV